MKTIVRRMIRAARRRMRFAFMKYVPFNQQYKPIGIKKLDEIKAAGNCELHELNPPYTSTLELAAKFFEECSPYIKPVLAVEYPADYIASIRNGRVFTYDMCHRAVISNDNYLIAEASLQWEDSMLKPEHNEVLRVRGFSKPKKYTGKVFSLLTISAAKYYYYHWMFDAIPKLSMLKNSGMFDEIDYFLVPTYEFPYTKQYLDHFGIHEDRIIDEENEPHIQADSLLVCSEVRIHDHHPKWACDFLYNSFKELFNGARGNKLIYIARGDAARSRKVLNESALISLLESHGFEIHFLSKLSVADQARLFNSARMIVAVHGGGLSNVVYCEPGTALLEIFPDHYVRHYYYDLCHKRDMVYDYLLCESEKPVTTLLEAERVNIITDLKAIKDKVEALLTVKTPRILATILLSYQEILDVAMF